MEEEQYYIGEQLKEMQSEVENERHMRGELARRLESLQSKVIQLCLSALCDIFVQLMGSSLNIDVLMGNPTAVVDSPPPTKQQLSDQQAAAQRLNERKAKAKKKEESKKKAEQDRLERILLGWAGVVCRLSVAETYYVRRIV